MSRRKIAAVVGASLLVAVSGCASSSTTTTVTSSNSDATALSNTGASAQNTGTDTSGAGSTGNPTDTSSSSPTASANSEGPGSYSHSDDTTFCSNHQCITNFPNGSGYVVQCVDGQWSHSGGLSGACSYHGGESSAGGGNSGGVSSSPATSSGNSGSAPTGTGTSGLPNQCDPNVSASANVTCGFAENTFYEYYEASGGDSSQSETVQAWSPTTHHYYSEDCSNTGHGVDCTFSGGEVQLTANGLSLYSSSQASSYAQSHDIGPNG